MNQKETLKTFNGKYGLIELEKLDEDGKVLYHVKHSNPLIDNTWWNTRYDAVLYYQFLCAKY